MERLLGGTRDGPKLFRSNAAYQVLIATTPPLQHPVAFETSCLAVVQNKFLLYFQIEIGNDRLARAWKYSRKHRNINIARR